MRNLITSIAGGVTFVLSTGAAAQVPPPVQNPASTTVPAATQPTSPQTQTTTTAPSTAPATAPATAPVRAPDEPATGQVASPPSGAQTPATSDQPAVSATGKAAAQSQAADVKAATSADVKAGVVVYDKKGGEVGKIESVSAKGAVVNTGTARAVIPVSSFGKSDKGLVMSMSKAELDAAAKKKSPKS
jgi:hypothetical protein